jgi:hypothetical protein
MKVAMQFIICVFFSTLLLMTFAFAQDIPLSAETSAVLVNSVLEAKLSGTHFADCARILESTQRKLGRELTATELERLLPKVLPAIEATADGVVLNTLGGLSVSTAVQTPNGPKQIISLRPGDEVVSFEPTKRLFVINKVLNLYSSTTRKVLGATPYTDGKFLHRFWVDLKQTFYNPSIPGVVKLNPALDRQDLLFAETLYSIGPVLLLGGHVRELDIQRDSAVFQLKLEREPHNFFADGFLVQSYVPLPAESTGGQ